MTHGPNHGLDLKPAGLMTQFHEKQAERVAHQLGAAARAEGHSAVPSEVPGMLEALCGLPEGDPLVVKVFAAYRAGFEAVA